MNKKFTCFLILFCLQISVFAQESEKKKLIELFSGSWCGSCPNGDYRMDTLIHERADFIPVVVHWDDTLSFNEGNELASTFAPGTPSASFDRVKFDFADDVAIKTEWETAIDHDYGSVPFDIAVDNIYDPSTRKVTIDIEVKSNEVLSGDFRVNCYIVQKAFAKHGDPAFYQNSYFNEVEGSPFEGRGDLITDYTFYNVARAMLGGTWGSEGVITSPTVKDEVYSKQYEYTLDEEYDFENFKIIAFVHQFNEDIKERTVYNSIDQDVKKEEDNVGLQDLTSTKRIAVYPNPATNFINIQTDFENANDVTIELVDVKGKLLTNLNFNILSEKEIRAQIPADILNGIYFIKMKSVNENRIGKIEVLR